MHRRFGRHDPPNLRNLDESLRFYRVIVAHDPRVHRVTCMSYARGANRVHIQCAAFDQAVVQLAVAQGLTCLVCFRYAAELW